MNNYLAHAKLLLLVTGGGHRISVILFGFRLVLPNLLHLDLSKITNIATLTNVFPQPPQYYVRVFSSHLFHQLYTALHIPLGAQQLGGGKFLPNLFREVVHAVRLAGHLNNQASRSLFMMMTMVVVVVMTMMLASSHLIAESLLSLREFFLRLLRFPVAVRHKGGEVVTGVHLVQC